MRNAQDSDEILLHAIAERDVAALEILYDRHAQTVYNLVLRIVREPALAEEVLQDIFWQVWQKAAEFPASGAPPTGTMLYNIDMRRDVLAVQNPPNDGVLQTVGALGVDAKELIGFDIVGASTAYVTLPADGDDVRGAALVSLSLTTGRAASSVPSVLMSRSLA